jgi:hypothetical protein
MPDPTLSDAIKEAYASAPTDVVIYHTLELWHPAFITPIRVVRDYSNIDAMIEATAARNPSEVVAFIGYAFEVVPPDQSSSGLPQCTIEIDNVSRDILAQIDAAIMQTDPITVIYRAYLSDALTDGPENDPPLEMTITSITATPLRISATAGFVNLLDQRFPGIDYDLETFPGLLP